MHDALKEYTERAKSIVEEAPQMGEANTKEMLIRRFIEALGWDFLPSEVELEYPVHMASSRKKVDYALELEGAPVVFVEAKGLDTRISNRHRKQITSYMHNEEGVEWGLLTNGKVYEFFSYDDTPSGLSLGKVQLTQLPRRIEIVKTISKKSVEAGESEKIVKEIQARRDAVSKLRSNKDKIAKRVTGLVSEYLNDNPFSSTIESQSKELVDRIIKKLEDKEESLKENEQKATDREEHPDRSTNGGDVVFTDGKSTVASFKAGNQSDAMAKAVEYLLERKDLLDKISLPYVPGRKKAILNDEPRHPDGSKMTGFREVYGDYCLDTHMSKRGKEKELNRLAVKCSLEVDFGW